MQDDGHSLIITEYKYRFTNLLIRNNIFKGEDYQTLTTVFPDFSDLSIDHNLFTAKATMYGQHHILDDPGFIDPGNHDFHLQVASPCIDNGNNHQAPIVDFDQISRPQGPVVDIGPYEHVTDPHMYSLTVSCQGMGNIIKTPDQSMYHHGTLVKLTAIPNNGWVFDHWDGDLSGTINPISLTMNKDMIIQAVFSEDNDPHMVTITDLYPENNAVQVPVKRPFLYAEIDNNKQTPIQWSITTNPNVGTHQGTLVNGPVFCLLPPLEYERTYEWTVHLETEQGWENTTYQFTTEHDQKTDIQVIADYLYSYLCWFLTLFRIM
jgi:hypothetical protein